MATNSGENCAKGGMMFKAGSTTGFINTRLINGCLAQDVSPTQKMVLIGMAVQSFDGEYHYSPSLLATSGCSKNTVTASIKVLIDRGLVSRISRCRFRLFVEPMAGWLNLDHLKHVLNSAMAYNHKLVLLAITKHLGAGKDYCWPKLETLARITGMGMRSISRVVSWLVGAELIERIKQAALWIFTPKYDVSKSAKIGIEIPNMTDDFPNVACSKKIEKVKQKEGKECQGTTTPNSSFNTTGNIPPDNKETGGTVTGVIKKTVAGVIAKMGIPKPLPKNTLLGLIHLWERTLPKILELEKMNQAVLTQKHRGMLKRVLEVGHSYDAEPVKVLEYALLNWGEFVDYVVADHDLEHGPLKPVVPWVVLYAEDAYQFYLLNEKKAAKKPVQLMAPKQPAKKELAPSEVLAKIKEKFGI